MSNRNNNSLIPTGAEVIGYIMLAAAVLAAINASRIWSHFSDGITVDPVTFGSTANIYWQKFDALRKSSVFGTASVMLFWGMIGSLAYALIWLVQNVLLKIKEDEELVANQREATSKRNVLQSVIAHYVFFAAFSLIILAYVFFFLLVVLPGAQLLFYSAVTSSFSLSNMYSLLGTVIIFAVAMYVLMVLLKLYGRFWRQYLRPIV